MHGACAVALTSDTIGGTLDRIARVHGPHEAVVSRHQSVRLGYDELRRQVERIARGLLALGVDRGARVGIWSATCVEWVVAQYAVAKVGAVLVHLNPAYRSGELEHAFGHSGVSVLIMGARSPAADHPRILAAARADSVRVRVSLAPEATPGCITWAALGAMGDTTPEALLRTREALVQCDDVASIMYTSGTTGQPKGVTLTHHSLLNNAFFIGERLRYSKDDRVCLPVPMYHTFGYMLGALAALTHGSMLVLPGAIFDPAKCLESIEAERCTAVYGVPAMFTAMLRHLALAPRNLESLRTGIMAGAPCSVDLLREVAGTMHMPDVAICYGLTEAGTLCQSLPGDPLERRVTTVGAVHPHVECKVVDPATGRIVPRGVAGELWARGYSVMTGYWGDESATRERMPAGGWIRTGDRAVMRADGYMNIVGRREDMVISAGRNIDPREVEDALRSHPAIREVAVIGIPDRMYGETTCAWIQPQEGHALTAGEVRRFCRERLAAYKVPRRIRLTDRFPMTASGKVQRFRLRELSIEELGLSDLERVRTA